MKAPSSGISLVEILISLTIFSTALVGLFMGINGVNQAIGLAMRRDIEASYANMILAQVNPYDRLVETTYDITSTACSGARCSIDLPYGEKIYYTRDVRSQPTTADVKEISVYLYRQASGGNAYRQFRKEVALKKVGYMFTCDAGTSPPAFSKDPTGMTWVRLKRSSAAVNLTQGSYAGGVTATPGSCNVVATTINGSTQYTDSSGSFQYFQANFQNAFTVTAPPLIMKFPATQGQLYAIKLGFTEHAVGMAAGARKMDIKINDQLVGTADPVGETGGEFNALVKSFTAKPVMDTSVTPNVAVLKIEIGQSAGATNPPRPNFLILERVSD